MASDLFFVLILLVHILIAVALCVLVLLQHGKGADMGASFGGGASGSLFGASGSANFMSRATAVLAALFFLTSLCLAYLANEAPRSSNSVMEGARQAPASAVPPGAGQSPRAADIPK